MYQQGVYQVDGSGIAAGSNAGLFKDPSVSSTSGGDLGIPPSNRPGGSSSSTMPAQSRSAFSTFGDMIGLGGLGGLRQRTAANSTPLSSGVGTSTGSQQFPVGDKNVASGSSIGRFSFGTSLGGGGSRTRNAPSEFGTPPTTGGSSLFARPRNTSNDFRSDYHLTRDRDNVSGFRGAMR